MSDEKTPYYLATAIAYPNGTPHIGHAYEYISADAMARFKRLDGYDVFFMTGTDEHGQKMETTAQSQGLTARELADRNSAVFKHMHDEELNISYDRFIRTTEAEHYAAAQEIWKRMEANGDIYKDNYGKWAAEALMATSGWAQGGDQNEDTGFAIVEQLNGQKLGDVVGQSGVSFNEPRGALYKAYGYPAADPFNGETLKSCQGTALDDPINSSYTSQGIPCDMTGGSSGGPWFLNGDVNGYQNSVNSYGYRGLDAMFGPYWNGTLEDLWNAAQAS